MEIYKLCDSELWRFISFATVTNLTSHEFFSLIGSKICYM